MVDFQGESSCWIHPCLSPESLCRVWFLLKRSFHTWKLKTQNPSTSCVCTASEGLQTSPKGGYGSWKTHSMFQALILISFTEELLMRIWDFAGANFLPCFVACKPIAVIAFILHFLAIFTWTCRWHFLWWENRVVFFKSGWQPQVCGRTLAETG